MPGDGAFARGGGKRFLTAAQEQIVRDALARGATHADAAAAVGVTYRFLKTRMADQLRDLRVGQGRGGGARHQERDPAPEEIAVAAAALRRRWTPDRWGLKEPDAVNDATRHGREIRIQ
jgi:hypothetical protein